MEILVSENVTFRYPESTQAVLKDISFRVEKGEFLLLIGGTGSGKTTLLRLLKKELAPAGTFSGEIRIDGVERDAQDSKISAGKVGFVMQSPEMQTVTDTVRHELAFGGESLGFSPDRIRRRVAEVASFFGLGAMLDRKTSELSGGQRQILALASILVTDPEILLLDEPTARLDPVAASEFLSMLSKLSKEFGITVILSEHRTDEALPYADRLLGLEDGKLVCDLPCSEAMDVLHTHPQLMALLPASMRIYHGIATVLPPSTPCPLTVRDAKQMLSSCFGGRRVSKSSKNPNSEKKSERRVEAVRCSDLFFRYDKKSADVLKGVDFCLYEGEILCLLGGNGSGKSTFLSVLAGLLPPICGQIRIFGKRRSSYTGESFYRILTLLPQDVQTIFLRDSVSAELRDAGADDSFPYDFSSLADRHPYDLSGGQQQLLGIAVAAARHPKILLLDEPTKGLDTTAKSEIAALLRRLKENGTTILTVTHDAEFAALCADRCALFFGGEMISCEEPHTFFAGNRFYTPAAHRITEEILPDAITVEEAISGLSGRGGKESFQ